MEERTRLFVDPTHLIELSFPILAIKAKGQALMDVCIQHEAYELCAFIKDLIEGNDKKKHNDFSKLDKNLVNTVMDGLEAKKTKSWSITADGETVLRD